MKRSGAITFPATEVAARAGLGTIMQGLAAQGLGTADAGNIEIALAEAVNNIVEHAYADRPAGQVRLTYEIGPGKLTLVLEDDGIGFANGTPPPGVPADLDVPRDDLPEGGFGWFLIRSLASSLTYRRHGDRNHLRLTFDLDAAGEG